MIIEATQTYSPGNIQLLLYLLNNIETQNIQTTLYLGHEYTYNILQGQKFENIRIIRTRGLDTIFRLLKKRSDVLYFCSFPPLTKNHNSVVYFHSAFFTNPFVYLKDSKITKSTKLKRILVYFLIKYFHKNVDYFFCQTKQIENNLKLNFRNIRVLQRPFFNDVDIMVTKFKKEKHLKYDFFYPATPDVHKNYFRLFDAVRIIGKFQKVVICVTIDLNSIQYLNYLKEVNNELGYEAILNVGRVNREDILKLYCESRAMVFPSLEESLGLPLIEAAYLNCPIVGSNLPFIYDVVENPIVFDPYDVNDISEKMLKFMNGEYANVIQRNKVSNMVGDIIKYFIKEE